MRTLKDVYIKVTKQNYEELNTLLNRKIRVGYYIYFLSDDDSLSWLVPDAEENKQKVSLSQLKHLINTIPTREEITRLKRQISAYKTNYDKVVKHSLSKEDIIEDLQRKLNRERSTTTDLFKQINTLAEEIERLKNINLTLKQTNDYLYDKKDTLQKENKQLKQRKWWQIWNK